MSQSVDDLIGQLTKWAISAEWIDWLELGGSLGRGAGDEWSDIDAGLGVVDDGVPIADRVSEALEATRDFAPIADAIVQDLDGRAHLIVVFEDGRQLSLVVVPASTRTGLPPQSLALLDRSGRLTTALPISRWTPGSETAREWAFEAWICLGDAARHAARDHPWRALRSLAESRDFAWQLWAASEGIAYPLFGAVSVENDGLRGPLGIDSTHPASLERADLLAAVRSLETVLGELTAQHGVDGVARVVRARIAALTAD